MNDPKAAGADAGDVQRTFGAQVAGLAAVRLMGVVAGFVTGVVGARLLGSDGLGAAGIAITLGTLVALVCNGGVNIATIYLLGQRPGDAPTIIGGLTSTALAGALLCLSLLVGLGALIGPWVGLDGRQDLFIAAAGLGAVILGFEFAGAVLLGLGLSGAYIVAELARGVGTLVATALLLLVFWRADTGFVVAAIAAQATAMSFAVYRIRGSVGTVRPSLNMHVISQGLGIGLRGQVGNVLQYLNLRLDQLLVPAFLSLSSAGVYLIAVRVSEALAQIGGAAGSLIFPAVARQTDASATVTTERAVRVLTLLLALGGLLLGLLADVLLSVAFGPEFTGGALTLRILLLAMLPLSVARILAGDLKGRGRPGLVSLTMLLAVVATVVLDVILIPAFGIEGAAIASVIAYSLTAAALIACFLKLTEAHGRDLIPRASDVGMLVRFVMGMRPRGLRPRDPAR